MHSLIQTVLTKSVLEPSLDEFHVAKAVAVVIGKTKAIEARCSRLGKPAFRVSFCKRLVRTVETVASRKLVNNMQLALKKHAPTCETSALILFVQI